MKVVRYTVFVWLLVVLVACGRQLPDAGPIDEVDTSATGELEQEANAEEDANNLLDEVTDTTEIEPGDAEDEINPQAADNVELPEADEPAEAALPEEPIARAVAQSDSVNGERLYNLLTDTGFACSTCHNANNEARLIGPGLYNIPIRAAERVEGQNAAQYIYNSIVHPNDYIVEGDPVYPEGLMPLNYEEVFTEQEIYDITAYLMTLADEPVEVAVAPAEEAVEEESAPETAQEATEEPVMEAEAEATEEPVVEAEATDEPMVEAEATEEAVAEAEATDEPMVEAEATEEPMVEAEATEEAVVEAEATEEPVIEAETTPEPEPERTVLEELVEISPRVFAVGNAQFGARQFGEPLVDGTTCAECHMTDTSAWGENGPGLLGMPERAEELAPGMAREYIYSTLVSEAIHGELGAAYQTYFDENAFLPAANLVAYLMTLDGEATMEAESEAVADVEETETADESAADEAEETAEEAPVEEDVETVADANPFVQRVAEADAAHGEELYTLLTETGFACSTCHNANNQDRLIGPGLAGIPTRAGERVDGQVAEEYLFNSIIHPNDYIVEGDPIYPEGLMPMNYEDVFTEQEIYDIVAYLMTLDE